MHIALFGGSGRTGQRFIEAALLNGDFISVLARTPGKISVKHENLAVVPGDILDLAAVTAVVESSEVVVSLLGPTGNKPDFLISRGMENILSAMHACGVSRLIMTAGAGVRHTGDRPGLFDHLIGALIKLAAKNVYQDMLQAVDKVRAASLDWTIVRVPMLVDGEALGKPRVGMLGQGTGPRITRAQLAAFVLEQTRSQEYIRRAPVIST